MAALEVVSAAYRARQVAIAARAASYARQLWAGVDPADIGGTWSPQITRMVGVTMLGQRAAATGATQVVGAMLTAQGSASQPDGQTVAPSFAQSAADGRPLGSLLYQPVMRARDVVDGGGSTEMAYASAGQQLEMMVGTEVADAGRQAMSTAMLADSRVNGYYREGGSCARCAILAGTWSPTYEGASFQRHPACHCTATPAADYDKSFARTPTDYFNSLSSQRQDLIFGQANSEMIRDGADPAQVINARRGMSGPGFNWTTTEGTTSHGLYGGYTRAADGSLTKLTAAESKALPPRLTPAAINRLSTSREESVAMLRKYGYLT